MAMTPRNGSIPGSSYQHNNGMGGAQSSEPSYTPIPCNTSPVDNQSGAGRSPDPSGAGTGKAAQEFWSGARTGLNGGRSA